MVTFQRLDSIGGTRQLRQSEFYVPMPVWQFGSLHDSKCMHLRQDGFGGRASGASIDLGSVGNVGTEKFLYPFCSRITPAPPPTQTMFKCKHKRFALFS